MLREFLNNFYIGLVFVLFRALRLLPLQKKIVFLCDFGDNTFFVVEELLDGSDGLEIVILKSKKCRYPFEELLLPQRNLVIREMNSIWGSFCGLFHVGTAATVVADNYFPILSVFKKKVGTEVIQLWHAGGAVKKFALEDPSFTERYSTAKKRIRAVYHSFDKVVVGTNEMSSIFSQAFGINSEKMLPAGIPRTDFFFDSQKMLDASLSVQHEFPLVISKKVILYAPTFRDHELDAQLLPINFTKIIEALGPDYVLLIRMHPAVKTLPDLFKHSRIADVSSYPEVNHLLSVTDFLITDYSSLPYEYALLGRPQIFYPYDLEDYGNKRGFWVPYNEAVPGPVVHSDEELISVLQNGKFDLELIRSFSERWNAYSKGSSSERLATYLKR